MGQRPPKSSRATLLSPVPNSDANLSCQLPTRKQRLSRSLVSPSPAQRTQSSPRRWLAVLIGEEVRLGGRERRNGQCEGLTIWRREAVGGQVGGEGESAVLGTCRGGGRGLGGTAGSKMKGVGAGKDFFCLLGARLSVPQAGGWPRSFLVPPGPSAATLSPQAPGEKAQLLPSPRAPVPASRPGAAPRTGVWASLPQAPRGRSPCPVSQDRPRPQPGPDPRDRPPRRAHRGPGPGSEQQSVPLGTLGTQTQGIPASSPCPPPCPSCESPGSGRPSAWASVPCPRPGPGLSGSWLPTV